MTEWTSINPNKSTESNNVKAMYISTEKFDKIESFKHSLIVFISD
jgi:hypothetical protein